MRVFVVLPILLVSATAAAQIADPWPSDPPSEPAQPQVPSPASEPPPPAEAPPAADAPPPSLMHMRQPEREPLAPPSFVIPVVPAPDGAAAPDATPRRRYALALVDRPLVLPSGVTELGLSFVRHTFVDPMGHDPYGGAGPGRSSRSTPDIYVAHAFSRAELGAGIGDLAYGWVAVDTQSVPARAELAATFSAPQPDGRYAHTQSGTLAHKLWRDPGRAALVGTTSVQLAEVRGYTTSSLLVSGEVLGAGAWLRLQVQAGERVGMWFGGGGFFPVAQSPMIEVSSNMSGQAGMLIALDSWDLEVHGTVADVTHDVITTVLVGFRKRWGLD